MGKVMWDDCGMARSKESLTKAISDIAKIKEAFWNDVRVPGTGEEFNQELENAGRVADFIELGQLMVQDALAREESCGGHSGLDTKRRMVKQCDAMMSLCMFPLRIQRRRYSG
jgi:succinate dehydrogenase / fumarate reductase flavoprotein subunit